MCLIIDQFPCFYKEFYIPLICCIFHCFCLIGVCFTNISGENSSYLSFNQGDLILLDDGHTGDSVATNNWAAGQNERTAEHGDFPSEFVYVLPALVKPPNNILALFSQDASEQGKRLFIHGPKNGPEPVDKPHTLEDYAIDHFRYKSIAWFFLLNVYKCIYCISEYHTQISCKTKLPQCISNMHVKVYSHTSI